MKRFIAEGISALLFFGAGLLCAWYFFIKQPTGFTDEDISSIKNSIREEFEKRDGVHVSEVTLIRKDSRELVGFAKMRVAGLNTDITKSCNATFSSEGQSLWSCP